MSFKVRDREYMTPNEVIDYVMARAKVSRDKAELWLEEFKELHPDAIKEMPDA